MWNSFQATNDQTSLLLPADIRLSNTLGELKTKLRKTKWRLSANDQLPDTLILNIDGAVHVP